MILAALLSGLGAAGAVPLLAAQEVIISTVEVERRNVFDPSVPGEDIWPFRAANRVHVRTRLDVIERELLLAPGRPWDPLKAVETERNLRALGFLRRAELGVSGSTLTVLTQDSWTLLPRLDAGTEGGETSFTVGAQENNLLGLGKSVGLLHSERSGGERRSEASYSDPRLAGTRFQFTGLAASTSRGDELGARLRRPFFSLDTAHAADLSWSEVEEEESLYQDASEVSRFARDSRAARLGAGLRAGAGGRTVHRVFAGAQYERDDFRGLPQTTGRLPSDKTLAGPLAGYSLVRPRYLMETDIDSMRRVEDFDLGSELALLAGPMLESWGSDRDRWVFSALGQQGLLLGAGRFALAQAGATGRIARDRLEDAVYFASADLFLKTRRLAEQTLVAHAEAAVSERLDLERQMMLGGDTGLRGYRNRSFTGDRALLLNLEDRFFLSPDFLHLAYLGWVVFFDAGAATPRGTALGRSSLKSDVGLGLRVSPSRSASGGVFRLDLAYALDAGHGGGRWVVSVRAGQAFSLVSLASRGALRRPDDGLLGGDRVFRPE